jgi:hypothetical protein
MFEEPLSIGGGGEASAIDVAGDELPRRRRTTWRDTSRRFASSTTTKAAKHERIAQLKRQLFIARTEHLFHQRRAQDLLCRHAFASTLCIGFPLPKQVGVHPVGALRRWRRARRSSRKVQRPAGAGSRTSTVPGHGRFAASRAPRFFVGNWRFPRQNSGTINPISIGPREISLYFRAATVPGRELI